MITADTYVRARIDAITKKRAADALEAMGLSISDAIRLLMLRVADERRLPFEVKAPNATTRKAIAELEMGKGKHFASVDALMADLHADD
jgi:DNA-damage-inducible protein J